MKETYLEQITSQDWLCPIQENSFWEFIKEFASPTIALLALGFAIYTHFKTRSLITHFERPIISLEQSQVTNRTVNGSQQEYRWIMVYKNKGKHPAINLKSILTVINTASGTPIMTTIETPNRQDPGDFISQHGIIRSRLPITAENPALIAADLEYEDSFSTRKKYNERFWYKFSGGITIDNATMGEKERIENIMNYRET